MVKGKMKVDVNSEQHKEEQHKFKLKMLEEKLPNIPDPVVTFEVGESVVLGHLSEVIVITILYNGKIIELDYTSTDNNYGKPISHEHQKGYWAWMDIRKQNNNTVSIIENDDITMNYSQTHLAGLFSKTYSFGVNFDPDYQRDYVWDENDKVKLIDSIYKNVDIGKFSFIRIDDQEWIESGLRHMYEILDGKQRMRAILDFYEGRFSYKGLFFNDLSRRDQYHFTEYSVNIAEVRNLTHAQKLRYFLMLNTGGRTISEVHLNNVRNLLEQEQIK